MKNSWPKPIPKCAENRAETGSAYCVSIHCEFCAARRAFDGVSPLLDPLAPRVLTREPLFSVPAPDHQHYFKYHQDHGVWYCIAEECEASK